MTTATGGQPASWTQQYVYDRYGNRTSVTASGTTGGGTSLNPPSNLIITSATANSISFSWTASPGADHYQIERRSAGNPAFLAIGTSTIPSYTDSTVTAGAAYVYRVRAADAQNNLSGSSNARLGVAIAFTDPTLVSGVTIVKAAHVTELRQAVNATRALAGLSQASWTDAALLGVQIKAVHVEELRTALTPALQALSLSVPGFTDAQLFGVLIKKLHIEELRAGLNSSGAGDGGGGGGGGSTPIPVDGLASASYNPATNRINSAGWEYDAAGNQTRVQRSDGAWQRHVYDAAGRLVKVQNDSGITQIIHTYGASNHRLIEQVGNESSNQRTYYAWAGDSVIAEYEETAAAPTTPRWVKNYVYLGARLLATIAPNGASERVEYHHPDRLGTRLVTNNQDTSSFEQVTLPFGTALGAESTGSTKRRFTSYDRNTVTGLDYAMNRHYDPLQGRFTQVDPIGMASVDLQNPQMLNLYAYCANDPVNHLDPNGLGFFSFLGKIFGAIGKALHFVAKVLAVVAAVMVVVSLALGLPGGYAIAFAIMSGILFASAYGPPIVGKLLNAIGGAAVRSRVTGTPPINPSGGTGVGAIVRFLLGGDDPIKLSVTCASWPARGGPNCPGGSVGQPGFWESVIPIWGSGRSAIDHLQNGRWGWGLFQAVLAVTDVFLVKSLVVAGGKLLVKAGGKLLVEETAVQVSKRASTSFGRSIESLRAGEESWRHVAAHIENATGRRYLGGVSVEDVFVNVATGERIYRHTIVRGDKVLHETFRTYSKHARR